MDVDYTEKMSLRDQVAAQMKARGFLPLKDLAGIWGLTVDCVKSKRQRNEIAGCVFSPISHQWYAPIGTPRPQIQARYRLVDPEVKNDPALDLQVPSSVLHWIPPKSERAALPWPVVVVR